MKLSWILKSTFYRRVRSGVHIVYLLSLIAVTTVILQMQAAYLHRKPHVKRMPTKMRIPFAAQTVRERMVAHPHADKYKTHVPNPYAGPAKMKVPFVAQTVRERKIAHPNSDKYKTPKEHPVEQKQFLRYQKFGRQAALINFDTKRLNTSYEIIDENITTHRNHKYYLFRHPKKMNSQYNGNITLHVDNPRAFVPDLNKTIYIMSAIAKNIAKGSKGMWKFEQTDPSTELRDVTLVGWVRYGYSNATLRCCLLLDNDTIVSFVNEKRLIWTQVTKQPLLAVKFFCPVPKRLYGNKFKGACISLMNEHCLHRKFLEIEFFRRPANQTLAVCAKIAYGQLPANRLIEWLEIQKSIGVDKVLTYYNNLNEEAMRVLLQYRKEKFVDLRPFDYPDAETNIRYVGQKKAQPFIDEQVVVYDALERLRAYTFVAVIDFDEIVYARTSIKHNVKKFVNLLLRREPKAAGFRFRTELFITDWENKYDVGPEMSKFWHARYQNRTRPLEDRTKHILVMDRIIVGSVWTHNYTARSGYKMYNVPSALGTIKHFRGCRLVNSEWNCFSVKGFRDSTVIDLMVSIKDTINKRFDSLLSNTTLSVINVNQTNHTANNISVT